MKRGASWELQLKVWHDAYARDCLAVVTKTDPPIKMLTNKDSRGQFKAAYAGKGPPDFLGIVGFKGVAFDAKEISRGAVLPLENIPRHQAQFLEAYDNAGAYAFIAARFVQHKKNVVFWWRDIKDQYWDDAPSVPMIQGIPMTEDGWLHVIWGAGE